MGDVLGTLVGGLVAGIIIGPLARLVLPGQQNISLPMTIVLGAIGAILGGFIYEWLGGADTSGIDWIKLAVQVAVGAVAVLIYGSMQGRKTA
ncbi:MAG: GlsB/YeaQ/YmgE family stress response membrane protein [Acidimicrobiia bacterium]